MTITTEAKESARYSQATQTKANAIARAAGYGKATHIVHGEAQGVIHHEPYGYRKLTTGEYVSNAYRNNFG